MTGLDPNRVITGMILSIVQVNDAGVASTFPRVSIARTWNVWLPDASPEYDFGVVHAVNPPASSWHSNVPVFVDVKVNDADVLDVGFDGCNVMVVLGAKVSIVQVNDAGVGSTFPAASIARTWNV